ncbi:MAG: Ig-like domain-containing protein, partial [Anaerolineae bacterium]|nr:Ig-like domain-containing protein [Anaerolineae bacterium]
MQTVWKVYHNGNEKPDLRYEGRWNLQVNGGAEKKIDSWFVMKPGRYTVEVYGDGELLSTGTFEIDTNEILTLPLVGDIRPSAPVSVSTLLLYDDFINNHRGWWTGNASADVSRRKEATIQNGEYILLSHKKDTIWRVTCADCGNLDDGYYEVNTRYVSGPTDYGYGLMLRSDRGMDHGYLFSITANGSFRIAKDVTDTVVSLVRWTNDPVIQVKGVNRLGVLARGSSFEFFINGKSVARVNDSSLTKGYFGLYVGSEDLVVAFSQVRVWQPRSIQIPKRKEVKKMKTILRSLTVLALLILGGLWITSGICTAQSPTPPPSTPTRAIQPTPTVTPRPATTPVPTPTPATEKTGYTLIASLSADPKNSDYAASFSPEVSAIYAWAFIVAEGGAAEKQFLVDIQFTSPMGSKADSKWYSGDTGKVTSMPRASYDAGKWEAKNVTRRQLDIAGTGNADLTGQWTVTFSVSGKVVHTENFTLATTEEITAFTKEEAAKKELEDKGYKVTRFATLTWDDGTVVASVRMPMVSNNMYSSETSQQLVDGFTADRKGFPNATMLIVTLEYTERYWIRFDLKATDWDAYVKTKDFNKFVAALYYYIWDTVKQDFVSKTEAKDFINKNFGAGPRQPPSGVTPKKGTVGSVRVQVSPSTLSADGTSTAQVTAMVYDKQNKPAPDTTLTFAVS